MKKRVAATLLWFYAMWYAGAMIATVVGLTPALGPILGTAAASIVGLDPMHRLWGRPTTVRTGAAAPAAAINPA